MTGTDPQRSSGSSRKDEVDLTLHPAQTYQAFYLDLQASKRYLILSTSRLCFELSTTPVQLKPLLLDNWSNVGTVRLLSRPA
mmetsp:Transcript_11754/g.22747  ORF Transcript_11754/g.22747 Transcript_11754/m.22747 type:complete len:82 (+) Transcript_11754:138-383(+)